MIAVATPPPAEAEEEVSALPAHVSPSAAKSYLGCSLKFYFERVLQLPTPTSPSLHLGKAVHAALAEFHTARWRGGDDSPEAAATAFDHAFSGMERAEGPVKWKDQTDRKKAYDAGRRVLTAYLDSGEAPTGRPIAVEVPLTEEVEGLPVPLTGTVDLVTGDLVAVDFKTAASTPDPETAAFDHEMQLVSYQLLIEGASGQTPESLDLVFLVKTKTPKVIRVSSPPADDARKARVLGLLATAVGGIAAGRFHPQPGMACSWCSYRAECAAWVPQAR